MVLHEICTYICPMKACDVAEKNGISSCCLLIQQWQHSNLYPIQAGGSGWWFHFIFLVNLVQVPFQVPLEVNVVLIGFQEDGGDRYNMDSHKFEEFLMVSFQVHRPM